MSWKSKLWIASLWIVNRIAKWVPFFAKALEDITNILLAHTENPQDVIRRRLEVYDHLTSKQSTMPDNEAPLSTAEASPSEEDRSIDTHPPGNDDKSEVQETREEQQQEAVESTAAVAAQEELLKHMLKQCKEDFQDSRRKQETELELIHTRETPLFWFLLVFSLVSLVFIICGGYLFFQRGLNVVAVLTELVGLLVGTGSLILRQLQGGLQAKAETLETKQEKQTRYLRAMQTTLALTGPKREEELATTVKWLREEGAK